MEKISLNIPSLNPIDKQEFQKKLQELASLSCEDLKLIHELATNEKYLKALKKHEKTLRSFAKMGI